MSKRKPRPQPAWGLETALLGAGLVGLAFSSLLRAEYESSLGLCSVGGGCDAVRMSSWSSLAGVPMPTIGIVFFLGLIALSVWPNGRSRWLPIWTAIGAGGALGLIAIQAFVIGAFCSLCLVVDLSALAAAGLALAARDKPVPALAGAHLTWVVVLAVAAFAAPGFVQLAAPAPEGAEPTTGSTATLPDFIAREQRGDTVTVVEFVDFECPACRYQHQLFAQALPTLGYPVRLVYLHAPLPQHPNAADAARAYLCAEEAGAGAAMADGLFRAPAPDMAAITALAASLGLDESAFGRCLLSARTEERLRLDLERADEVGLRSLPTFWIGRDRFVGVTEAADFVPALDRESRRHSPSSSSGS